MKLRDHNTGREMWSRKSSDMPPKANPMIDPSVSDPIDEMDLNGLFRRFSGVFTLWLTGAFHAGNGWVAGGNGMIFHNYCGSFPHSRSEAPVSLPNILGRNWPWPWQVQAAWRCLSDPTRRWKSAEWIGWQPPKGGNWGMTRHLQHQIYRLRPRSELASCRARLLHESNSGCHRSHRVIFGIGASRASPILIHTHTHTLLVVPKKVEKRPSEDVIDDLAAFFESGSTLRSFFGSWFSFPSSLYPPNKTLTWRYFRYF